jgi:hypothetical protein
MSKEEIKSGMAGCCGPEMNEMMKECPCGSFMKKHRLAFFAAFTGIGLVLLTLPVGVILGIIAFFRTF